MQTPARRGTQGRASSLRHCRLASVLKALRRSTRTKLSGRLRFPERQISRIVDIAKKVRIALHHARPELGERTVEGEVIGRDPALEDGQSRTSIGTGQRAGLRDGGVDVFSGRSGERAQERRRDEGHIGREDDAELRPGETETGREADDGGTYLAPVVEDGKRKRERVLPLPHRDHLREGFGEDAVRALGEALSLKGGERLRRAEPAARAADEENAGQLVIRHGSE